MINKGGQSGTAYEELHWIRRRIMKKQIIACLLSTTILCSGVPTALAATPTQGGVIPGAYASLVNRDGMPENLDNLALNPQNLGFPKVFAEFTCSGDKLEQINDGIISSKQGAPIDEGPRNRWTNYNKQGTAYVDTIFETEQNVYSCLLYTSPSPRD